MFNLTGFSREEVGTYAFPPEIALTNVQYVEVFRRCEVDYLVEAIEYINYTNNNKLTDKIELSTSIWDVSNSLFSLSWNITVANGKDHFEIYINNIRKHKKYVLTYDIKTGKLVDAFFEEN